MKQLILCCIAVLSLVWIVGDLRAQASQYVQLDRYLDTLAAHDQVMVSVVVLRGDERVYKRAIGNASLDPQVPATPERRYRIGSISKTYTAALIMHLVQDGKLSVDQRLNAYFPQLLNAETITLEQMLRHRSGLNSFTDDPQYEEWKDEPITQEQLLAKMAKRKAVFAPGERSEYSNSNYVLLGYIVERVTGMSYGEALEKYVLEPLKLEQTRGNQLVDLQQGEATSFTWQNGKWIEQSNTHPSVPGGAGAISATAEDVARFYRGLFLGQLLDRTHVAQMLPQDESGHGMGLLPMPFGKTVGYGHTGGIDGFRSQAAYWPTDSLTVVVLTNGSRSTPNDVMIAALSAHFGLPVHIPNFTQSPVQVEQADLQKLAGVYASEGFSLEITIRASDGVLYARATGQSEFAMEAYEGRVFKFQPAGIRINFENDRLFVLEQGGRKFRFSRK